MRRGLLKNYADTVCDILAGWRLHVSGTDMALLMEAGQGRLVLNLLDASAKLDDTPVPFLFAEELRDWLQERAEKDGLGWVNISRAELEARFDFRERTASEKRRWWGSRPTPRLMRELKLDCLASIDTSVGMATSRKTFREVGMKVGDGPWVVH